MSDTQKVIMKEEFIRKFFSNAYQTKSYPPSLVEDLCVSHEALRAQLAEKNALIAEAKELAEKVETVRVMAHPEDCKALFSNINYLANEARDFLKKLEERMTGPGISDVGDFNNNG